jgi:hypothetical protein
MILYDDGQFIINWNGSELFRVLMNGEYVEEFRVYETLTFYEAEQMAIEHVKNDILGEE